MKCINKFFPLVLLALAFALLNSGCASKTAQSQVPKTPEQAGIKTADSTTCEGCHLDPSVIGTYEKPQQTSNGGETKGG